MMVVIKRKNLSVKGSSDKHFRTGNVCEMWNKLSLLSFLDYLFFLKLLLKKCSWSTIKE